MRLASFQTLMGKPLFGVVVFSSSVHLVATPSEWRRLKNANKFLEALVRVQEGHSPQFIDCL